MPFALQQLLPDVYSREMTEADVLVFVSKYSALFVTSVLGGGIGAFVGSYLKKKGENLATHEDIDKLVSQMTAVTQATKEIEAKISSDVWDRQRRWETKKEFVFDVVRSLGPLNVVLTSWVAYVHGSDVENPVDQIKPAMVEFERARMLAFVVCEKEVNSAIRNVDVALREFAAACTFRKTEEVAELRIDLDRKIGGLMTAIRNELNL